MYLLEMAAQFYWSMYLILALLGIAAVIICRLIVMFKPGLFNPEQIERIIGFYMMIGILPVIAGVVVLVINEMIV